MLSFHTFSMLKVGITGGIGSGKSTVARVFEILGIPVYYADHEAKKMMSESSALKNDITTLFGSQSYLPDGTINRKFISGIVFDNPGKLAQLNNIIHPAVLKHSNKWMQAQQSPYCIKEAALLFESGAHQNLDTVIGVFSPLPLRMKRIMERDHITIREIKSRISKQIDEDIKMRLCDSIITNDEQLLVIPQVLELHHSFLRKIS